MSGGERIVITGGLLIDPASQKDGEYDVLVEQGVIRGVEPRGGLGSQKGAKVIDAKGMWVVPGLIDLHVHLREPGFEWKETIASGSEAAVIGGFTSVCCMPNTDPRNDSAEICKFILEKSAAAGGARVLPIGAVSKALEGKEMAPLSELRHAGCVAFSDDGEPVYDAGLMRRALEWSAMLGVPISCHEEDKSLSCHGCMNESGLSTRLGLKGMPKVAEEVMIARDIELARTVGAQVHICHVSTGRGVELIRRAKGDGIKITAEVTPHHLMLTEEAVAEYDTNAKMSPPLREQFEVDALRAGLKDGSLDAVASDHAPHEKDSKEVEFSRAAMGILGLQTSLPLVLELHRQGLLSRMRAIDALTSGPARAFGLAYGSLRVGAPADVTIIDPKHRWTFGREVIRSLSFNSPFIGRELEGAARAVVVGGKVAVEEGAFAGRAEG
jgi:dihydroorotase